MDLLDILLGWCSGFGYTHQSPAGDLFAVSVVGCLLGYSSCLVVWIPLFLDPSDGVFGRFDLAALCGCRTLNFCLFVLLHYRLSLRPSQVYLAAVPMFIFRAKSDSKTLQPFERFTQADVQ